MPDVFVVESRLIGWVLSYTLCGANFGEMGTPSGGNFCWI